MDLLNNWIDAAKQIAQNAIKDKVDAASNGSGQVLLNVLADSFRSLPEERRQQLFHILQASLTRYQADPHQRGTETLVQELIQNPLIRELAGQVTEKLLKTLLSKVKPGGSTP